MTVFTKKIVAHKREYFLRLWYRSIHPVHGPEVHDRRQGDDLGRVQRPRSKSPPWQSSWKVYISDRPLQTDETTPTLEGLVFVNETVTYVGFKSSGSHHLGSF